MYPLVELLTALLFLGCYAVFGLTTEALKWAIFSALVIVLVFTDLRERILPDAVNYTGFALGLALSFVTLPTDGTALWVGESNVRVPSPSAGDFIRWMRCWARRSAAASLAGVGSVFSTSRARREWAWET